MKEVHECEQMKPVEAWIECDDEECSLNINRVATDSDIEENHYLEYIGQTIEHVALNVLFCPYCGVKLRNQGMGGKPSFAYNDFSKCRK